MFKKIVDILLRVNIWVVFFLSIGGMVVVSVFLGLVLNTFFFTGSNNLLLMGAIVIPVIDAPIFIFLLILTILELRNSRAELEQRVNERTEELHTVLQQTELLNHELCLSEEDSKTTLASIGDGVISTDRERQVVRLNRAAELLTGWTAEEAIGHSLDEIFVIINEETRELAIDPVARVLETGRKEELANHIVLIARDGTERAIADSAAPIRTDSGKILGVVLVFRDVTEERRHREEREQLLCDLQERVKEQTCLYAVSDVMMHVDAASEPEALMATANLLPQGWKYSEDCCVRIVYQDKEYLSTDFRETPWRQGALLLINGQEMGEIEVFYRVEKPEVDEGPFLKEERELINALAERVSSALGRLAALKQLQKSEEHFRTYFEEAYAGMAITSPLKGWLQANRSLLNMLGYTEEELYAKDWAELTYPDDLAADVEQFNRMLDGEIEGYHLDKRFIRRDGNVIHTVLSVRAVRKSNAEVDYVLAQLQDVTIQREQEQERERERKQLFALFDNITDVIYVADPETYELLFVNKAFCDNWGEDVIGQKCYKVLQGLDKPCSFCSNDKILNEHFGETYIWEFQNMVTRNWYRCVDKAINWIDGRVVRFEIAGDITDLKNAQAALAEQEARYRTLVENIPQNVFVKGRDHCWVTMNRRFAEGLGVTLEEAAGRPDAEFFPPELVEKYHADDQRIMESGVTDEFDEEYVEDGERRIVHTVKTPVHDKEGNINGVLGIFWDVTEEKRMEEYKRRYTRELAVRNRVAEVFLTASDEDMYAEVLAVVLDIFDSPFGVFGYIDENGDLVVPTMTRTVWDKCKVADKKIVFPHKAWGDSVWPRALREKRTICVNEPSTRVPEGHISISRNIAYPLINQGKVVGLLQIANKPTDYTEEDIQLLKAIGSAIAPVLDARLQREQKDAQLQVLLEELKRSNQELEQFAYVASHDLQEPLRMVSSYTQLLAERYQGKLDEKAEKFINYAVDGAVRMQRLINDLLSFSRVTTRGGDFETVDSHAVLGTALVNLQAVIEETGAMITNDDLPDVQADQSQLAQVFQNLIGNAIKFQKEEAPRIHVSAELAGEYWRFIVKDNGIGIDSKHNDRVFVIFQRLHSRAEYPGTGIGLALCKRIIERHGGKIWFESTPGQGTTFYFTLPKAQ